jgi:hypothetical protein
MATPTMLPGTFTGLWTGSNFGDMTNLDKAKIALSRRYGGNKTKIFGSNNLIKAKIALENRSTNNKASNEDQDFPWTIAQMQMIAMANPGFVQVTPYSANGNDRKRAEIMEQMLKEHARSKQAEQSKYHYNPLF